MRESDGVNVLLEASLERIVDPRLLLVWEQGACRGADTELFFPASGKGARQAKAICAVCPVRAECLDYAVDNKVLGVWGGTSEHQRRYIRWGRGRPE